MGAWLEQVNRHMYLPLDLMIALLERKHDPQILDLIVKGADGAVLPGEVLRRLKVLSSEIEEDTSGVEPTLNRAYFSRGFIRILEEAHNKAQYSGSGLISEEALAQSVVLRLEVAESASVRWAVRRLGEGKGDELFDQKGFLRDAVFSAPTWQILQGAMGIAAAHGTPFLGTPHLVAMLCSVKDSTLWRSAKARGLEPRRLREELLRLIGHKPNPIPEFLIGRKTLTPRMIRMLSYSAEKAGEEKVNEVHLVEGFLADGGSSLELVQALGVESELRKTLGEPIVIEQALSVEAAIEFAARRHPTPTLDMLGRDLTEEALAGRLPEIVGRDLELQRVINVLLRREQRNPILCGEAGVGKTALAVGLALRIASGQVPKKLQGYRVIELNGASLVGGTSYRGDLEARIKSLLEEAKNDVILFIDEAHAVFAPRSSSNAPAEVPNHFKRALASGDIALVGATTEAEYHRWFEQDSALKRRFERIEIQEPSEDLVRQILQTITPELEEDYQVRVEPAAVDAAIELSVRFLPEQRLPDKAKKLLMDACIAQANELIPTTSMLAAREELLEPVEPEESKEPAESAPPAVGRIAVAQQVCMKTGIPLERLLRGEISWWVGIEERLGKWVLGQAPALRQVAHALVSSRLRRAGRARPMAVLLFVGPAGVGKSTLATALAREIFSDPRALIRLDMNDFQESHSMSRLIGSPPGYVGYEDEDLFVTPLRRRPSSVVLFEDFDRAHPGIQQRILRLIDEGEITDTRGHRADVQNSIFIFTIHADTDRGAGAIGFSERGAALKESERELSSLDTAALDALDASLAAHLRGHIDAAISFHALGQGNDAALELLARRQDAFIAALRDEYNLQVELAPSLESYLQEAAARASDARQLEELVNNFLYLPITQTLLNGSYARSVALGWDEALKQVVVSSE